METLSSRNGATILTALEVPELITYSLREYEEKALYFSQNINELKKLKQKILEKKDIQLPYLIIVNLQKTWKNHLLKCGIYIIKKRNQNILW